MKAEFVNPFITAAADVLNAETKGRTSCKGNLRLDHGSETSQEVTAMVGLTGGVRGVVMLAMPEDVARKIYGAMVGEDDPELDEMEHSALGELCNMITGQAATLQGVPVVMMPLAVGGGFGGGSVSRTEFMVPMPDGGIAAIALDMQIVDDAQAAGQRTGVREPDLGVMAPPKRKAAASQARLMGLISVLGSSQDPLAAYKMIEWLSAGIERACDRRLGGRSDHATAAARAGRAADPGHYIAGRGGGQRGTRHRWGAGCDLDADTGAERATRRARGRTRAQGFARRARLHCPSDGHAIQ